MIKVKDGYAKLIGTTYQGSATQVLLSNGGNLEFSSATNANTLVQRNASQHIYATYFNSAISDEALTDIGSVYVRNTSDTFIRRISKTQFYSIIDNKFVTLDTAQTITGVKTFSTSPILADNATIIQNQKSTGNYTTVVKWLKGGTSQGTYNPSIGQHNTGGDGTGSICILPYPTETRPWDGTVGLFVSKGVLKLDGQDVIHSGNYTSYVLKIGTATVGATNKGIYLNAGTPTAMSASAGSSALPVYMASGAIVACTASSVFSALANSGNNLSITVAGQNRQLVVNYSTYASYLSSWDNRSVNNTPSTYGSSARFEFKANSADGLSNGGSYHGILHFKPYGGTTDFTGGQTHQLGFTDSGNLYMRTSTNSTTWGAWKLLMNEPNANSKYVTALGTSGNYVTWTKNGTTNNLTVPYATNADKLDGYHANTSQNPFGKIPTIGSDGVMEVGRYLDFHYNSSDTSDYRTRLYINHSSGSYTAILPAKSGTLAMTSDIPTVTNYYWANVRVSSSSSTGTSPTFSTAYTSNWFRSTGNTGWYSETYGGGWHMTDTTYIRAYNNKRVYNANAEQYAFYTAGGMTAAKGFWHSAVNSNAYVLLAGGSYKGLGDFAKGNAGASNRGVYVAGGTVTAMTYYLNTTVNSGTSGNLAYYSRATTLTSYTNTVGSSAQPMYLNAGVPTACTSTVGRPNCPIYFNEGVPTTIASTYVNYSVSDKYSISITQFGRVVVLSGWIDIWYWPTGSSILSFDTSIPYPLTDVGGEMTKYGADSNRGAVVYIPSRTRTLKVFTSNISDRSIGRKFINLCWMGEIY